MGTSFYCLNQGLTRAKNGCICCGICARIALFSWAWASWPALGHRQHPRSLQGRCSRWNLRILQSPGRNSSRLRKSWAADQVNYSLFLEPFWIPPDLLRRANHHDSKLKNALTIGQVPCDHILGYLSETRWSFLKMLIRASFSYCAKLDLITSGSLVDCGDFGQLFWLGLSN